MGWDTINLGMFNYDMAHPDFSPDYYRCVWGMCVCSGGGAGAACWPACAPACCSMPSIHLLEPSTGLIAYASPVNSLVV